MKKHDLCSGCSLEKIGKGFVPVDWNPERFKGLLICGEGAGDNEAREGKPFRPYAPAGSLLSDAMRAVNISRSEVAICNAISCHTPGDWLVGAPWGFSALNHCAEAHLRRFIQEVKPRVILALGGTAQKMLTAPIKGRAGVLEVIRGYAMPGAGVAEGIPVVSGFHPAALRRGMMNLLPLLQRDLLRAFRIAMGQYEPILDPRSLRLDYQMMPSLAEAWEFARSLSDELPLALDIETPLSTRDDEDERTSFTDRDIKLIQFSQQPGKAIVLPWRDEFVDVAKSILRRPMTKTGFNSFTFDHPVLEANGAEIGGEADDTMVMFHVLHPDLPMNLQTVAQFCGWGFAWKHYAGDDISWYGAVDADSTLFSYNTLKEVMQREGLWDFYVRYFRQFWPILRDMAKRGLPINETKRLELKSQLEAEDLRIDDAVKALVPREWLGTETPLKRVPKDLTGFVEVEVVLEEEERCQCLKKNRGSCALCAGTGTMPKGLILKRWGREVAFNPNSSKQVKMLIKRLDHPMPKHAKRTDQQTGEAAETTEVKQLERLFAKTKHPLYPLLIEKRQVTKLMGVYVEGWQPGRDGRLRTTFSFKPATLQTSSKAPNIQNGLKHAPHGSLKERMARGFAAMQQAEDGHLMMNFDMKSFHAQTTACEAGLADYLRLAKIDIHSFVTCHYLRLPERIGLYERPDEEMREIFKQLKKDSHFKFVRDYKAKRTILGIQFAMWYRKLYQLNPEDFDGEREAKALWELIMLQLFPGLRVWQDRVREEAHEQGLLRNKFGAIRRFYDVKHWDRKSQRMVNGDEAEAAVAFLPASSAFGHMRDVMLRIREQRWDERYQLVNSIHDSLVFHCPIELVDECRVNITAEMQRPSDVLRYSICPDGLSVEAEASVGESMAEMATV